MKTRYKILTTVIVMVLIVLMFFLLFDDLSPVGQALLLVGTFMSLMLLVAYTGSICANRMHQLMYTKDNEL